MDNINKFLNIFQNYLQNLSNLLLDLTYNGIPSNQMKKFK